MDYSIQTKDTIKIIGISLRTTNENDQSATDIPQFWQKFFQENILSKIPNKKGMDVFSVYTKYEGDFMAPYTVILGCEVTNFDSIPTGMTNLLIPESKFAVFHADGPDNVASAWGQIWQTKLGRTYYADFEVYKESVSQSNPVVEIFVGIQ